MIFNFKDVVFNYIIIFHFLLLNPWFSSVALVGKVHCEEVNSKIDTEDKQKSLQLVQVLYRHGDRNPTKTFPTDQYADEDTYWPEGKGELTLLGKQQLFELGAYLRKRYASFIKDRYHKYDILVTSSDNDRTIMSAQAAMAGFYPPINSSNSDSDQMNSQSWNPYVNWQMVPIHSIPRENDSYIAMKAPCPKFTKIYENYYKNGDYPRNVENDNKELRAFFVKNMGLPADTTIQRLLTFYDTLMVHRMKNLSLPNWLNESTFQELNNIVNFQFTVETSTPELKRLKGGPMLYKVMSNIADKVNWNKTGKGLQGELRRKLFIYSGHDTTVGTFLNSLDIYNNVMPPYAGAVILELHSVPTKLVTDLSSHDRNKLYYVKILYRNDSNVEPFELEIPGCSFPCSVKALLSILEPIIPPNWEEECKLISTTNVKKSLRPNENLNSQVTSTWLLNGGIILAMAFLAFVIIFKFSSSKRKVYEKY